MKAETAIKTTVTVDLGDFATSDLIDELESRGYFVDEECTTGIDTNALLEELANRSNDELARIPLDRLIEVLSSFGAPPELIDALLEWERQPVPTKAKLEKWCEVATR